MPNPWSCLPSNRDGRNMGRNFPMPTGGVIMATWSYEPHTPKILSSLAQTREMNPALTRWCRFNRHVTDGHQSPTASLGVLLIPFEISREHLSGIAEASGNQRLSIVGPCHQGSYGSALSVIESNETSWKSSKSWSLLASKSKTST